MNTATTYHTSPSRPVGVWIMTILNIVISGIFPIITAVAYLFLSAEPSSPLDLGLVALQGVLGGVIMWASIGAWRGKETARRTLLTTLIGFHSLQILSNAVILIFAGVPPQFLPRFLGAVVRSLFWISINRWYFRCPHVRAWFGARSVNGQ